MRTFSSFFKLTSFIMGSVFAAALVIMMTVAAVDSLGVFELDGDATDLASGTGSAGDDWSSLYIDCPEGNVRDNPPGDDCPPGLSSVFTGIINDENPSPVDGTPDSSIFWKGGSKDIHDVPDWWFKAGSTPDKDQITNAYAAAYSLTSGNGIHQVGDLIVNFGLDRFANNGDAHAGFWFFHQDVGPDPSRPSRFTGMHQQKNISIGQRGDILVLVEYPQGSNANPLIRVYEWDPLDEGDDNAAKNLHQLYDSDTSGQSATCGVGSGGNKLACAITNDGSVNAPWSYTPKSGPGGSFPAESFYEGSINFTQLLGMTPCFSSFLAETRASRSEDAKLWDHVGGEFDLCSIDVLKTGDTLSKVTDPVDYTFKITNTGAITLYQDFIIDTLLGDLVDPVPASHLYVTSSDCGPQGAALLAGHYCTIEATRIVVGDEADGIYDSSGVLQILPNTLNVSYNNQSDLAGDSVDGSDDHSVNLFQPSFTLVKSCPIGIGSGDGERAWKVGEPLDFRFTLTNTSSSDTPIMELGSLTDPLFGGNILALLPQAKQNALAELAIDESIDFVLSYTPSSNDIPGVTNTADAVYSPQGFTNQIAANNGTPASVFCPVALPGPATILIEKELRGGGGVTFTFTGGGLLVPGLTPVIGGNTTESPHGAVRDAAVDGYAVTGSISVSTTFGTSTQYTVTESGLPAGTTFESVSCRNPDGELDTDSSASGATATINVDELEVVVCRFINIVEPKLTLVKSVTNDNGGNAVPGDFELVLNGGIYSDTVFSDGAMPTVVAETAYTLTENPFPGYSQDGDVACVDDNTAQTVSHPVTLDFGQEVTCTVVNDDITPTITLIKEVVNDNGGNAGVNDFGLSIGGTGVNSGVTLDVDANIAIALTEAGLTGYEFVSIGQGGGDAAKCPAVLNGTVTLDEDEHITCTIVNDDIAPSITLIKEVINDNGGNAGVNDFGLSIGGTGVNSGETLDVDANTAIALTEAGLTGYNFVSIGQGGGDSAKCPAVLNGTVTLDEDEHVTCTIVNDDITPTITLIKEVINDNGGNAGVNDFGLSIGGTGVNSGLTLDVDANTAIALTEAGLTGYNFVSIGQGNGDSAKCPAVLNGTVTLNEDEHVTCTIVNDDITPTITLIKHVINDNGGNAGVNDFGLSIGGAGVNSGVTLDVEANIAIALTEVGLTGYEFVSIGQGNNDSAKCPAVLNGTVTLDEDEHVTCTIVNDDITPTITLIKEVINDNGGNAGVNDFGLSIGGAGVNSGLTLDVDANTAIALTEAGLTGYNFVSIGQGNGDSAKCPAVLNGTVTLDEDEHVTCTIVNDDITPTITLIKHVINDNGGNAGVNDFGLSIGGAGVNSGVTLDVDANIAIALTEAGLTGYEFVSIGQGNNDSAKCPAVLNGTVTLNEDEHVTCTIVNDDITPTITLIKEVINDDGGTAGVNDFGLSIGGTGVNSGVTLDVDANTAIALNEAGLMGYEFVSIGQGNGDSAKCPAVLNGTVTLNEDEHVTCTIVNDDLLVEFCPEPGVSGRPKELTMMYDGVSDRTGPQTGNEVVIDPFNVVAPDEVYVEVYTHRGKLVLTTGALEEGDSFSYAGFKGGVSPRSRFLIYDYATGDLIQTVQFHTSCSQPINLGDSYGLLTVSGGILGK
ncbi:prealbumin-like fold domain-containing protein [Amphritea balenae]|uniref:DUF11 domain-containing protein n=1 Tax=Amphritea balenae TaxID=452629 RepID=A0A3P1SIE1_9GAMM|nr:hypothetical protein [Amphritea balenae]RRC96794.1 hypothetical protein EHS89_20375 [Amphritea balenae]GGK84903.1 hypothetical protein GCM10007941_39290 [Amphritea balenae]